MRHRAALPRALMTRPSLLLMDEPFGALDAITRLRMHEFLLRHLTAGTRMTIIFVTHDIEESVLLADRVAIMGGRPARQSSRSSTFRWGGRARGSTFTPSRSSPPSGRSAQPWTCERSPNRKESEP